MIKINLDSLKKKVSIALEKKGAEYIKRRAEAYRGELEDLASQWLKSSRILLGKKANPKQRASGEYPSSYKWLSKGTYHTDKMYPKHFLIDSLFFKVNKSFSGNKAILTLTRGFKKNFTLTAKGIDYSDTLNTHKYIGYKERITDTLDSQVEKLLNSRRFK